MPEGPCIMRSNSRLLSDTCAAVLGRAGFQRAKSGRLVMRSHRLAAAVVFLGLGSSIPSAAEEQPLPRFKAPPNAYHSRYGGELLIGDRTTKELTYWFHLTGANNHVCNMTGTAIAWDKEHYRFSNGSCVLDLIILGRAVVLSDQGNECQKVHCGSRAYIDGTVLFQKK
jgi:hypothetical protein